jgi:alpha,alpha-trehalose-phosphate synthase [UDP-forming]
MLNKESLEELLKSTYKDHAFVVVSNREPYLHTYDKAGKIVVNRSVGGVSVVFDSILKKTKGTWVAYGGSLADKATADKKGHIMLPPGNPSYLLRRVWMSEKERQGYYEGFSNEALWPLCHIAFVKPIFRESDWAAYKTINKRFAKAVLEEIKGKKAVVWIQDYQLALVGKYIKQVRKDVVIAHFWHIPWPPNEIFRICPWRKEILSSMLSSDMIGFHCNHHVENFLKNIANQLEAKVNFEEKSVTFEGKKTYLGVFPISVDFQEINSFVKKQQGKPFSIEETFGLENRPKILAVGVDRVDYTKGMINRFTAIERFLEKYPKYHGKFSYLGIGAPSRTGVEAYRDLNAKLIEQVDAINKRFGKKDWQPIYFVNKVIDRETILKLFITADICLVTPLDDGMNLVAKEYVAANNGDGALILSNYVGAARELTESYSINPYNTEQIAEMIDYAIRSKIADRKDRMMKMKKKVEEKNLSHWAYNFLKTLADISAKKQQIN